MSNNSLDDALSGQTGTGQESQGISAKSFLVSVGAAAIVFAVQVIIFILLKPNLTRIYQPRTYLVPERERTKAAPTGLLSWILPVLKTSNSEFIQKCGLDAYFFLRFLRMLLKIFVPLALLIIPILVPMDKIGGRGTNYVLSNGTTANVTGLDQYAWGNVTPEHTNRYWAHLVLAVTFITYASYIFFDELRGYIRLRQAYLTSPQHRIRASATTVLVSAIPRKWLSVEALDGLYDVFPGGIRNIWINRNFDELNDKIKERDDVARTLEAAETDLIKKCKKAQLEKAKKEARKNKKSGKEELKSEKAAAEERANQMARGPGISSGNPHQVAHTVDEAIHEGDESDTNTPEERGRRKPIVPIPVVGDGLDAVTQGIGKVGHSVLDGLKRARNDVDTKINTTGGLVIDKDSAESTRKDDNDKIGDGVAPGYRLGSAHSNTVGMTVQGSPSAGYADPSQMHPALRPVSEESTFRPSGSMDDQTHLRRDNAGQNEDSINNKSLPTPPESNKKSSRTDKLKDKMKKHGSGKEGDDQEGQEYPSAINEEYDGDDWGEPVWKKYIKEGDRDTMRRPLYSWMFSLPLIGKKVDTIYWCRKELARLNLEIEQDQKEPEKYPLMNSAFIQFNHQVAAHMACQAISHHLPKQMAPRVVEISPDDVIWDNMAIRWWERYARTAAVVAVICGMVVLWAIPVAFTGVLSQISYLSTEFGGTFAWIMEAPEWVRSAIQGLLPPLLLGALMSLLPVVLRFLCKLQGLYTGMAIELAVQRYYFAFLFVQIFLVVSISSSFTTVVNAINSPSDLTQLLAQNIPKSSNYFFSYLILQAMSVSAAALLQIWSLIKWFILAPMLDSTARKKWSRTTTLERVKWGQFFPKYTTFASIGFIYSIISPFIMIINILTFSLFWFVYRYNTLYVTKFRFDTGGLLFPKAINQLFTGIYFMEIVLVGLFFLVRDEEDDLACKPQAIIMIVVTALTVLYQILLNQAFAPLYQYLPVTLEDDAVRRDEEFARAQGQRLGLLAGEQEGDNLQDLLAERERKEREEDRRAEEIEMQQIEAEREDRKNHRRSTHLSPPTIGHNVPHRSSWADRSRSRRSSQFGSSGTPTPSPRRVRGTQQGHDTEAQDVPTKAIGEALFAGIHDELEDLTPDERDQLVQRAFQHEALRVKRPVVWIPRDDLGVSDDEVYRTQKLSKHVWISNEYQALDGKCRCIFSRSPPDFSEVDLIQL